MSCALKYESKSTRESGERNRKSMACSRDQKKASEVGTQKIREEIMQDDASEVSKGQMVKTLVN